MHLFQRLERFIFFLGYLNQLEKYVLSVCLITFQTLWKENSLHTPFPFGNLPLSDPPTPRNFCDPRGVGMDIFSNHTINRHNQRGAMHGGKVYETMFWIICCGSFLSLLCILFFFVSVYGNNEFGTKANRIWTKHNIEPQHIPVYAWESHEINHRAGMAATKPEN